MNKRQCQRGIGADARRQPEVGDLCSWRALGVDYDQAGTALLGRLEGCPLDGVSNRRVAADDQRAARALDVLAARDVEAHGTRADRATAATQILVDHPVG